LISEIKMGLAQINTTVGDFKGNRKKISQKIERAEKKEVDILVFPEMAISGYPPSDLLKQDDYLDNIDSALSQIVQSVDSSLIVILGFVNQVGEDLYSSVAVIQDQDIEAIVSKSILSDLDLFNESKYFTASGKVEPVEIEVQEEKVRLGIEPGGNLLYQEPTEAIIQKLVDRGADLIINPTALPFYYDREQDHRQTIKKQSQKYSVPVISCNLVAGQDEAIFEGGSFICNKNGEVIEQANFFEESLLLSKMGKKENEQSTQQYKNETDESKIFDALVLGVQDYFSKTGFDRAVLGLSGGIDSALTATIAKDALGSENVTGISMPSQYTSDMSNSDAQKLAGNLGISFDIIPVKNMYDSFLNEMSNILDKGEPEVTEENLQARIRGDILMSWANKNDALVLNTGNKTELALGYCTMYGDMCGAIGVLADLSKTKVYDLAKYYNHKHDQSIIPSRIIERQPSAELKMNQVDPFDYEVVSPLVDEIIGENKSRAELIEKGYNEKLVDDINQRIVRNEFKRSQAPIPLKVTTVAFDHGRYFPIVNKFKH